jgi:hypothetical protein
VVSNALADILIHAMTVTSDSGKPLKWGSASRGSSRGVSYHCFRIAVPLESRVQRAAGTYHLRLFQRKKFRSTTQRRRGGHTLRGRRAAQAATPSATRGALATVAAAATAPSPPALMLTRTSRHDDDAGGGVSAQLLPVLTDRK